MGMTLSVEAPGGAERRAASRRNIVDTHLVTVDLAFQAGALLLDLSETGMGVQALAAAPLGSTTSLHFELPEVGARVDGVGTVAWTDSSGRVGIRFDQIVGMGRGLLAQWLMREPRSVVTPAARLAIPRPPQRERDELSALRRDLVSQKLEGDAALHFITERMRTVTRGTGAAVALESGGNIVCRASSGNAPALGAILDPNTGLSGECVRTGEIVRCEDAETDPRADRLVCRRLDLRSVLIVPVKVQGRVIGLIEAFSSRPHAFESSDVLLLRRATDIVAGVATKGSIDVEQAQQPLRPASAQAVLASAPLTLPPPGEMAAIPVPTPADTKADAALSVPKIGKEIEKGTEAVQATVAIVAPPEQEPAPRMPQARPAPPTVIEAELQPVVPVAAPEVAAAERPAAVRAAASTVISAAPAAITAPASISAPAASPAPVLKPTPVAKAARMPVANQTADIPMEWPRVAPPLKRTPAQWVWQGGVAVVVVAVLGIVGWQLYRMMFPVANPGAEVRPAVTAPVGQPAAAAAKTDAPKLDPRPFAILPAPTVAVPPPSVAVPAPPKTAPKPSAAVAPKNAPTRSVVGSPALATRAPVASDAASVVPPGSGSLAKPPETAPEPPPAVNLARAEGASEIAGVVSAPAAAPALVTNRVASTGVQGGKLIRRVEPVYPSAARSMHVSGSVVMKVTVDTSGKVGQVTVVSGSALLVQAAVAAVKSWRYEPFRLDGKPVEGESVVTMNFRAPN